MKIRKRKEECMRIAYEYIKAHGPCDYMGIMIELNKRFNGNVMRGEVSQYLSQLRRQGLIEHADMTTKHIWKVTE